MIFFFLNARTRNPYSFRMHTFFCLEIFLGNFLYKLKEENEEKKNVNFYNFVRLILIIALRILQVFYFHKADQFCCRFVSRAHLLVRSASEQISNVKDLCTLVGYAIDRDDE